MLNSAQKTRPSGGLDGSSRGSSGAERQQVRILPVTVLDPPLGLVYRRKLTAVLETGAVNRCDARSAYLCRPFDLFYATGERRQGNRFERRPIRVVHLAFGRL